VPVLLFLLLYYVSISIVRVNFVRNLLPVLPVLCLLAGSGVDFILVRLPLRGTIRVLAAAVVVAALVALPLTRTVTYDRAIANSTRLAAGQWIRTHLPQGSKLATEIYGPEPIRGWQSVTVVIHLSDHAPEWYESNGFDYIVASSGAYEMAYSNPSRYREAVERYEEIFSRFPRVAEFKGETVDPRYSSICPTILILAVPGRGRTATAPAGEIP
jgi:hypothetical protein